MKKALVLAGVTLAALAGSNAYAIDRGARMIDWIGGDAEFLDDAETIAATLWGETRFAVPQEIWAFLIGAGAGELSPDAADDAGFWNVGLGLKFYAAPVTSVALIGRYAEYDYDDNRDVQSGELVLRHRLIPAEEAISPYVFAGAGVRFSDDLEGGEDNADSEAEPFATLGGGADFMMNDEMAMVFEGAYTGIDEQSGGYESDNGWRVGLYMKYYWGDEDM